MKVYLGDGVYAQVGNWQGELLLTTEDGIRVTNSIMLEPEAYQRLIDFVAFLAAHNKPPDPPGEEAP